MSLREAPDRRTDEIAVLQADLESTRAYIDQRMDAHHAHLQKLSQVCSQQQPSGPL